MPAAFGMTIVVDQTCASLADRLRAVAPIFVFTRAGGTLTKPDRAVIELRDALQKNGLRGPYLIVAASFAGFTALLYAHRHPQEVAGLVLVDSSHPQQSEATIATLPASDSDSPEIAAFRTFLRGFGPDWEESCRVLRKIDSLGDLPLIALAADTPLMPASLPLSNRTRLVETWHSLQQEHARRSTRGEMRIVKGCGHALVSEAPEAVIAAVEDLFKTAMARPILKA
jgi:pimeloyl-ACP methyl ester carboxylesterase